MSGSNSSAHDSAAVDGARPEPLTMSVHSLPAPMLPEDRRARTGRIKMLLVLLVCAAPVIASYFTYYVIRPEGRTNYGELIESQPVMPMISLRDLEGRVVEASSLKGQWLMVVVAGGACDALCERHLYLQRQLRETLGKDRDRLDKVWLIPDDAVVRPEVLRAIEGAVVLRASEIDLATWLSPSEGRSLSEHIYMVNPLGVWMMRFPVDPDPSKMKRDLGKLMRGSQHWDRAGR